MQNLDHVVDASHDVAPQDLLVERMFASDFSLQDAQEMSDDLWIEERRVLRSICKNNITDVPHKLGGP